MKYRGKKILFGATVLLTILTLINTIATYKDTKYTMTQTIKDNLQNQLEDAVVLLEGEIERRWEHLQYISEMPDILSMEWEKQYPVLKKAVETFTFKDIFIVTPEGLGYYSRAGMVKDHSNEEFFKLIQKGDPFITEPFIDGENEFAVVTMALPIKKDGKIMGSICGIISLNVVNNVIQNLKISSDGYGFIFNQEGRFISNPDMNLLYDGISILDPPEGYEELSAFEPLVEELCEKNSGAEFIEISGSEYLAVYQPLDDNPWMITYIVSRKEAMAVVRESLRKQMLVDLGAICLIIIVALFVNKWISLDISRIKIYAMDESEPFSLSAQDEYEDTLTPELSVSTGVEEISHTLDLLSRMTDRMEKSIQAGAEDKFKASLYLDISQVKEVEEKLAKTAAKLKENLDYIEEVLDASE